LQVTGIAAGLAEAGEGALNVADGFQAFAEFGEDEGRVDEGFHQILTFPQGGEVAQGFKDPIAKPARAHGGGGAVHRAEQGVFVAAARGNEVEIGPAGGVDEDGVPIRGHAETAQVIHFAAEHFLHIMQHAACGTKTNLHSSTAIAVEGLDLEMRQEIVPGLVQQKRPGFQRHRASNAGEVRELILTNQCLSRGHATVGFHERGNINIFGEAEVAGGMVQVGETAAAFLVPDGGKEIVPPAFQQIQIHHRAGRDDLGDLALYQFAGDGFTGLLGDGDAFALADEALNVAFRRMIGHAAHRDGIPLCQSQI